MGSLIGRLTTNGSPAVLATAVLGVNALIAGVPAVERFAAVGLYFPMLILRSRS
jgi:hypothetical protein